MVDVKGYDFGTIVSNDELAVVMLAVVCLKK